MCGDCCFMYYADRKCGDFSIYNNRPYITITYDTNDLNAPHSVNAILFFCLGNILYTLLTKVECTISKISVIILYNNIFRYIININKV